MLRESVQKTDNEVNFLDATQGYSESTKIPYAKELIDFAEAIVNRDEKNICITRNNVFNKLGNDATVDTAAVASAFHGFVRIADTIGIPYKTAAQGKDDPKIRAEAGINTFYRMKEEQNHY